MESLMITFLEWAGSLFGLFGSFLLATNSSFSAYGWVAFSIANVAMICFSMKIRRYGLLVQSLGFTCTSLLGLYRSNLFATLSFDVMLSPALLAASAITLLVAAYLIKRDGRFSQLPFQSFHPEKIR
jgi:hypothetical protein